MEHSRLERRSLRLNNEKVKVKASLVRKVQEKNPSNQEMVAGVIREGEKDSRIRVSLGMTRQGDSSEGVRISLLADTGVRKTILNLGDWEQLGRGELKETRLKFRPYGTNHHLPIIGR